MANLPVPFCINCQHCSHAGMINDGVHMCERTATVDIVTGRREVAHPITCREARGYGRECGPEGREFKRGAGPKTEPPSERSSNG